MKHRRPRVLRARPAALAAVLAGVALAGCGAVANTIKPAPGTANNITVELAGPPNGFYVGLYEAQALGYFKRSDLNVKLQVPTAGQDPVAMVHGGEALVAVASEPTVLLHRNENEPVVGVAALVHQPLGAITIHVPPAGPSGGSGLSTTGTTTTGTTTTGATTTGATTTGTTTTGATTTSTVTPTTRTATPPATTTTAPTPTSTTTTPPTTTTITEQDAAVWPTALQQALMQPSAPTYDGLVLVVRKGSIVDHAPLLRRFVQAVAHGYRAARANPAAAVRHMATQVPALVPTEPFVLATVNAAIPYFFPKGLPVWGWQRQAQWNRLGTWMTDHKFLDNPNAVTDASTNELLQGQGI
jgi:ABC-type nitrate/sulfonate/bicarbonate transport system substrate-binding protein